MLDLLSFKDLIQHLSKSESELVKNIHHLSVSLVQSELCFLHLIFSKTFLFSAMQTNAKILLDDL